MVISITFRWREKTIEHRQTICQLFGLSSCVKMILVLYYFLTSIVSINCIDLFAKVSYNLPNLSACSEWNPNGTTFRNDPMRTFQPYTLFLDRNNTLYVTNPATYEIYKSLNGSNNFNIKIIDPRGTPQGLFVSTTGDIFTSDEEFGLIDRWIGKSEIVELAVRFCGRCESIFISVHDVIYCSGATKIFRVVGKLLLYRKKSMGKMGGNFTNRQKFLGSTKD